MPYYVYIIKSEQDGSFYKGYSESPLQRLPQHNNGESHYTSLKTPWVLVYIEKFPTKRDALIREKALKKFARFQVEKLILTEKNIITRSVSSAG